VKLTTKHDPVLLETETKNSLGRVLITWRSGMGDSGRIVSQRIIWKPSSEVSQVKFLKSSLKVRLFPPQNGKVIIGQECQLTCSIQNQSNLPVDICLKIEDPDKNMDKVNLNADDYSYALQEEKLLIYGPKTRLLGRLQPSEKLNHTITIIPSRSGFYDLANIYIVDLQTGAHCRATGNLRDEKPLRIFIE